ncbi:hypothetical protein RKE30_26830 [Streptomyces sp. Li-HN-5-11]|uniref:hypothetical protein n=1 Tax=Streptomyces sp. Li-HN-5-11 TaxID=3075432 RepID=UPI0028AFA5D0|nr:hypothetical protein [Streptomyces sp. Li-HN-5-11]WNM33736.1 hypothetical protein RKE30_26830 [Streptomyces sp. Li-HN-5-11]
MNEDFSAPAAAGAARQLSRRRFLGAAGALGLAVMGAAAPGAKAGSVPGSASGGSAVHVTTPPAHGVLAANYNQDLDLIDFAQLQAASASWLRGFSVMKDAAKSSAAAQSGVKKLLDAAGRGYGTVLTLKFQYQDQPLPAPGSKAMGTPLAQLQKVLAVVLDKVDIVVIGNEPFYETTKADRLSPRINAFYEALARHAIEQRGQGRTQLYMGALTGIDEARNQTPQTDRWVRFAARTAQLAGVDIHPHVASMANARKYVDYVLSRLRPDQRFLATEFSLVKLWKQHMKDPVDPGFATRCGMPSGTQVWQVLKDATRHRFGQEEWNDFLATASWLQAHRDFLTQQMAAFRATGRLAVAGYGISQDKGGASDFTADKTPWVLNSLFCPRTVRDGENGLPGENPVWLPEFRAAQHS